MTDCHQECVDKGILSGVVKLGKYWVNINKYHYVKQQDHHEDYRKCLTRKAAHAFCNGQVKIQKCACYQHDQVDDNRLF